MNTLDIILIATVVISFIFGYFKGLISQLTFGMGIVIGLLQAVLFYSAVAQKVFSWTGWNEMICNIVSFVGIIILILILFKLVGWTISKLLEAINLRFIDKTLGALFSVLIAILLVVGIVNSGCTLMPDVALFSKTTQSETVLYKHVQDVTLSVLGELKK